MNIQCSVCPSTSALALVIQQWDTPDYLSQGPVPDLADIARRMRSDMTEDHLDHHRFLSALVGVGHRYGSNREWAMRGLSRLMSPAKAEIFAGKYAGHLTDLERAFDAVFPDVAAQSVRPLQAWQGAWQTHGQRLLQGVGQATDPALLVEEAQVVMIGPPDQLPEPPFFFPYLLGNIVIIPPIDPLPPGLDEGNDPAPTPLGQLVWCLAQLNLELPRYTESFPPEQAERLAMLSMVPAVLTAQLGGEFAYLEVSDIQNALQAWMPRLASGGMIASDVAQWWQVYCRRRPDFGLALKALGHTLSDVT